MTNFIIRNIKRKYFFVTSMLFFNLFIQNVNSQILINEVSIAPSNNDGSFIGTNLTLNVNVGVQACAGEWIELYNTSCNEVNIGGYIIGTYNSSDGKGMSFRIPDNKKIPPKGFAIIRGVNTNAPSGTNLIDIIADDINAPNFCIEQPSATVDKPRMWFQNLGGWIALYKPDGLVADMIKYGTPFLFDLDESPCLPTGSQSGLILSSFSSYGSGNSLPDSETGKTYVRLPDGGSWSNTLKSESSSYGTNNQTTTTLDFTITPTQPTCTTAGSIVVSSPINGVSPYQFKIGAGAISTGAFSNTTSFPNLSAATYYITMKDNSGCAEVTKTQVLNAPTGCTTPTPLPCGTVGIDWRNTPTATELNTCVDKDFSIRANTIASATQYIAPGFDVEIKGTGANISTVRLKAGTGNYVNGFTNTGNPFSSVTASYCSPNVDHYVEIVATSAGTNSSIEIVDHATGQVLITTPVTIGTFVITIPANTIKGKALYTGPGVSNYTLNQPVTGATNYTGSGSAVFNPSKAGNGIHKINYSWNNGNQDCGTSFIEVEVKGCTTPPVYTCQPVDFEIQNAGVKLTNLTFSCSDNKVNLVALDPPSSAIPDKWIYPGFILYIKPQTGTVWGSTNKIDLLFNGTSVFSVDVLADLTSANLTNTDDYIFPVTFAQAGTFSFKLNGVGASSTKKFDYIVFNAADGTVADQGVLDKNKTVTLAKSPVGTAKFTGPGVTDDPDNGGKGFFDPKVAGAGTHKILYSWDNGTAGTTNCKGTKEITVTVTGGPTVTGPTTICDGTTVEWTSTAPLTSSDNTFVTIASSGANKYNITALKPTTSTTNLKLTATSGGCSAVRDVTIIPKPTITGNLTLCADATSTLTGSGTAATTTPWVSATTSNATISNAGLVTAATAGNGTSEITYTDNNGCIARATVTVNPILQPTVTCGTSTATSVTFSWNAVPGATSYDLVYNKDNTGNQTVPGHTLLSYPVSSVPAGKSVTLIVTPKGTTGCFKASVVKTCTADNCPSPTITQDPVNTSKCVGEGASFSVTASSTATLSYKWQINNGSNPPTDITDAGVYSGASTSSLTISDVTGLNGVKYQCLVTETTSGTGCNKTSVAATLTVNPLPTFIPTALDICEGETPVITYPSLTGTPDKIIFDPGITGVTPINLPLTASPFKITGLTLPVNTYSGVKVKLENSTTGCKSTDITIPAFKVLSTQKPSISSKSTSINSVIFQWPDLIGLNTQTGTEDKYTVKEFVCTGCTTPGTYVTGTGTLSYNASTSKWEYLRNVTNPGDKVFIEVTPVDVAPLATPSCFAASTYDLLAITCTSPIITKDIIDVSLCEGTSATPIPASFELEYNTADPTTPITWEILKPGATWTTLNPTGVYTITATSTYIDNKLSISDIKGLDGTKYRANIKTATPGGSCNTISYEALLTVKPLPTITPITDKSFCPGTKVNDPLKTIKDIEFKVSQYGTPTFSWVSDVQTTGVSSGLSNVNSFASFTTLSPSIEASSKITVTPTLNGCVGSPIDFKVIVKPKIKPIFSTPSASDITYSSVKFNWNSSLPTIIPDEWKVDTISVLENASDPLPTSYFSVSPNRTSAQNFYTYNVKSGKKAFIIVTPISTGSTLFCADTARKYLIPIACVTPTKPLTPVANPVCEGSALDLTGVLTDATADFQWKISTDGGTVWNNVSGTDFGSTGTTNVLSTSTTKSYMNNALVKLVLTDKISGQCTVESDKVTLAINPLPTVNLIQPSKLSLCVDDPEVAATVQPLIGKTPMKIDYTLNSVTSSNQDIANLEIKFSTIQDKIHSLTIDKVIDANGCESLLTGISSTVTINKNPTPDFIVSDTIGCIPLNIVFTDNSGIVYKDVTWDFGTGSNSSKDKGSSNYSFQKAGDFTISYSVEDSQGCKAQIIKTDKIHAKNTPIASISTDRNLVNIYENEVRFDSKLSQNASFYIWDFGDNSPISNDPVVKHKYDPTMPGKYKVSLIVSNSATNMSCSDTAVTWIDFPEEVIYYIPNTFTPNGDEFNNTFQPIFSSGYDPQNYSFIVFDRWGQIVFESNNPTVGWDGTFGDQVLGNDTFVWKLGFKEKANDNEHYSTGHVNLVK